jgi:hypothetical protein
MSSSINKKLKIDWIQYMCLFKVILNSLDPCFNYNVHLKGIKEECIKKCKNWI